MEYDEECCGKYPSVYSDNKTKLHFKFVGILKCSDKWCHFLLQDQETGITYEICGKICEFEEICVLAGLKKKYFDEYFHSTISEEIIKLNYIVVCKYDECNWYLNNFIESLKPIGKILDTLKPDWIVK